MRNFFEKWLQFSIFICSLYKDKKQLKKFGNVLRKVKSNFASVATLAVLAILQELQALQIVFFASGYSFAVLATTLKLTQ